MGRWRHQKVDGVRGPPAHGFIHGARGSMMRILLCMAVLLLGVVDAAAAQRRVPRPGDGGFFGRGGPPVEFGVRGGYDFDADVGSAGAQLRIPLIRQLLIVPSGDVFFADEGEGTDWQINADLLARPDELGGIYGGIGAAFLQTDFDLDGEQEVEAGYNLLAGIEGGSLLSTRVRPFAEARWTFVDELDPFRLVVGINTAVR
jgi:hypothetical protein